jgi:hypothetical protein
LSASFEGITDVSSPEGYTFYDNGVMGPWKVYGNVYIVYAGSVKIYLANPYPYGIYACMLQNGDTSLSYIERTFQGIVPGASLYVSFWITTREGFDGPLKFSVYLNSELVFSEPPTTYGWKQVNTTIFMPNVTYLTLRFEITKLTQGDRDMGINGIIIHQGQGTSQ